MELIKQSNIDFVGKRKAALVLSLVFIVAGLGSLIIKGGPNYSIDFEGGTLVQVQFTEAVNVADVRSAMNSIDLGDAVIQQFGQENEILIRMRTTANGDETLDNVNMALGTVLGDANYEIRRLETVGPKIGKELKGNAIKTVLFAMLGIVLYITIRFKFMYAIGALAALAHDVIITLGIFSLLNIELSLPVIAAFLTIVGYSLNDTIVVYDRIRENVKELRREKFTDIVNASINGTLSRTVITSLTTLVVVVILYFMGGEVINSFAFALIIGVLIGTYSSIFIASPVLIAWEDRLREKTK
jgi:preprotein translocase subunit SecF